MSARKLFLVLVAILTCVTVLEARPKEKKAAGWAEPFVRWDRKEATELLKDSPWAKTQNVTSIINTKTAGDSGEKALFYSFTARFFSALPIREGYVRLYQILNNYGELDAAGKQEFDARFKRALDLDTSNRVIVALEFATNDPQASRDVMTFLHAATKDTFKLNTFLVSDRIGRVDLAEYYPPSTDGTGAKFVFPRVFNGQPVIQPGDKNVRLDLSIPMSLFSRAGLSASPDPNQATGDSVSVSGGATGPATVTSSRDLGAAGSVSSAVSGASVERQGREERILLTFDVDKMNYEGKLTY